MDPFRAVSQEVKGAVSDLKHEMAAYKKLPAKSPKAEMMRSKIFTSLSELQVDLKDMQATIDIALNDPAKFALTPSELMTRQEFVRDLQAQTNDMRDEFENGSLAAASRSLQARGTVQKNDRQELLTSTRGADQSADGPGDDGSRPRSAAWRENENALGDMQMQQQRATESQEVELKTIGQSIDRLGEMGRVINQELRQQGKDLDDFNSEVEDASSKMAVATAAMKKMLAKKDGGKLCAILVLSIVLILLMYAVFAW